MQNPVSHAQKSSRGELFQGFRSLTLFKKKQFKASLILSFSLTAAIMMPAASEQADGFYVLCYHAIKERKDPYSLSPDTFRKNIEQLQQNGFTFITFDDAKSGRVRGVKNVLVTIDDGHESVWDAYFTIMKPAGIKPVLGIYPAIIGKRKYAMTWEQLKTLRDEGCYIAAHGYNHMYLSSKYYKENIVQFKKEIYLSKKVLEQKLNITVDTMIYPFGVHSNESLTMLKDAGYKYGFTLDQKRAAVPISDGFHIPRYMMTKPAHKGIIARFIKNTGSAEVSAVAVSSSDRQPEIIQPDKERVTIKNYPVMLKKLVINDIIFMPENKTTVTKKQHKKASNTIKPLSKNSKKGDVKDKKIKYFPASKNKKMTGEENKIRDKKQSYLRDMKQFYIDLLQKSSNFIFSLKQTALTKLEQVKQKTAELFS